MPNRPCSDCDRFATHRRWKPLPFTGPGQRCIGFFTPHIVNPEPVCASHYDQRYNRASGCSRMGELLKKRLVKKRRRHRSASRRLHRKMEPRVPRLMTIAIPPGPICSRCGHQPCPCCPIIWCDHLKHYIDEETGECDADLCCDGECQIPQEDWDAWRAKVDYVLGSLPGPSSINVSQVASEGPWQPVAMRRK